MPINLYIGDKVQTLKHIPESTISAGTMGIVVKQSADNNGKLQTFIRFDGQTEDVSFSGTTTREEFRKLPRIVSIVSPSPVAQPFPSLIAKQDDGIRDDIYSEVLHFVAQHETMSATLIHRHFGVGYPRAASIIVQLEQDGVISALSEDGIRKVLDK